MRKMLACVCALLLLASLAVPLAAAGEAAPPLDGIPTAPPAVEAATETDLPPAAEPTTVDGARLENGEKLFLYEKGAPVETLTEQLDKVAYLQPLYPLTVCDVTWDIAGCDLASTGRKTLRGQVKLPANRVYLVDGLPAELWVEANIMVYEDGMSPIETVHPNRVYIYGRKTLVPLGSGAECLDIFMGEPDYLATAETADNLSVYCRARFDRSRVDLNKVGLYYGFVYGLPSCFTVVQNDPEKADVVVLRDDIVDLTYTYAGQTHLLSEWLYGAYEPTLWVARDVDPEDLEKEAVWAQVPERTAGGDTLYTFSLDLLDGSAKSMRIPLYFFENAAGDAYAPGNYYFQVRHRDGVSNITSVKVSEGQFVVELPGGDKDGGDAGDEDPPVTEQPPPGSGGPKNTGSTTPSGNPDDTTAAGVTTLAGTGRAATGLASTTASNDDTTNGMERSTATETTVSGLRLHELMALQGEWVLFQKKGFSARFETAFLKTLALADQDLFTVTLEALDGLRYRIGAAVNGVALSSIPGTRVELWYNGPAGPQVTDEQDNELPDVVYDETQSLVAFTVDATGTYTLLEPDGAAVPPPVRDAVDAVGADDSSLPGWGVALAVCGVGLPAAGVAGGLWRRRAKGRRGT